MANDYINKITATDGTTYDIKDTVSGYTTNTGTVTGMTTTAGSHTAGTQTVTNGIITTNIPTKTSHLTNDSGFITTDSDEKLKTTSLSTGTTSYLLSGPAETTAANKYYVPDITAYRNSGGPTYLTVGSASGAYAGGLGLANNGTSKGQTTINPSATSNIILTLPNATGTIALTADIPTVPAWAQASTKPTYTASEVGALPTSGGQLTGDLTLYVASGNSPGLIFQRGTLTDNYNDWMIYDKGGYLYFAQRGSGSSSFGDMGYIDTTGVLRGFTIPWGSVSGKPSFATVATSGSYNDLSDTPAELPTVSASDNGKVLRVVSGAWSAVSLPSASGVSF